MSSRRRHLHVALALVALALVALLVLRRGARTARDDAGARAPDADAAYTAAREDTPTDPATPRAARPLGDARPAPRDAAAVARTVRDRALRDEFRRAIYAAWSAGAARPAAVPPDPLRAPMPERDGGGVDPDYIRERVREDFLPMAHACYEQLLARQPGAAGRVRLVFTIVGDEHVGGVVDEATVEGEDGGFGDREFATCVRESTMALAFRPPARGGRVTVRYPVTFSPDAPDGGG